MWPASLRWPSLNISIQACCLAQHHMCPSIDSPWALGLSQGVAMRGNSNEGTYRLLAILVPRMADKVCFLQAGIAVHGSLCSWPLRSASVGFS